MGRLSPARARLEVAADNSDLYRVAGILLAKKAGLALTDIRDILTTADLEKHRNVTRRHRDELVRRIAEMQAALNLTLRRTPAPPGSSTLSAQIIRSGAPRTPTRQVSLSSSHRPVVTRRPRRPPGRGR